MCRQFRRIRWMLPCSAALALVAGWTWRATRPALEWWTSPREQLRGHWFQARLLIPSGWELDPMSDENDGFYLWRPPNSRLPAWLRWLRPTAERDGTLK